MKATFRRTERSLAIKSRTGFAGVGLIAVVWFVTSSAAPASDDDEAELIVASRAAAHADPRAIEVRFNDDSRVKCTLAEERIEVNSRYGTLQIAVSDIRKIDFALRLSDGTRKQINDSIEELGSIELPVRKAAIGRLAALGPIAYPSLLKVATRGENAAELRAADLVAKLKETVDEQEFVARELDVIQTVDSTISGHIINPALKIQTGQFGELSLKIADARSLRWQGLVETKAEPEDKNALPDPGNLYNYPDQSGKTLKFRVTGRTDGFVWGTDVYTADSPLATAAVHAGAIKAGQSGIVKVKIIPPPPAFGGSTRNGIASQDFGPFPEAYRFVK